MTTRATMIAVAMILTAGPLAAQPVPPPGPGGPPMMRGGPGGPHGRMFGSMSDAGRRTMIEAMKGADPRADHEATKAARDRVLDVLDNDRLDVTALKRALDDEREASTAARMRHQAAMLAGFQKLSVADRKAFVADARAMRDRMEGKMKAWMGRRGGRGTGDMPPPPPM